MSALPQPNDSSIARGRVLELDGLRAVSVIVILLFHFGVEQLAGGYVGVDVFFVLSGYLITSNILAEKSSGTFSVKRFYVRRARRLLPAFYATLAVTLLVATFLMSPEHLERLAKSAIYSAFSLVNFFFLGESGYFDTSSAFKPLLHFWSLAVEEQFYLVWPALILLLVWINGQREMLPALLIMVGVVSFLACELTMRTSPDVAFFMMPMRAYEFALGALCLNARKAAACQLSERRRALLGVIGLSAIVVSCLAFDESTRFPGTASMLPATGAALVIISDGAGVVGKFLRLRVMVALGLISYSVYLVHWPLVTLFGYWAARTPTLTDTPWLFISSLALGTALYHGIERRFRTPAVNNSAADSTDGPVKSKDNCRRIAGGARDQVIAATVWRSVWSPFFFGLALSVGSILTFAIVIWSQDGMGWRLGPGAVVDLSAERRFGCKPSTSPVNNGTFCRLGVADNPRPQMLVLGDSHVEQLRPGFDALGKRHGYRIDFWTSPGCPPLRGTYKFFATDDFGKEEVCKALGPEWEQTIDSGRYPVVALGSRWMRMFESDHYGGVLVRRDILVDRDEPVLDTNAARTLFDERLRETVDRIHMADSRAVVFSQVPLLAKNIQGCDRMPTLLDSPERKAKRCNSGVSRADALARLRHTDETIMAIGNDRTLTILFSELLCSDGSIDACQSLVTGRALYHDDNHLSGFGSHYVSEWLEPGLVDFINRIPAQANQNVPARDRL